MSRLDGKGRQQPTTDQQRHFRFKSKWTTLNRGFRPDQDALHQLDRKQQTAIFRLRTGHCGLRAHLKRIGQADTATCHCGNDDQTPEHVLQACPLFDDQRKDVWPDETDLETKLWGTADNLRLTTRFTTSIGLQI